MEQITRLNLSGKPNLSTIFFSISRKCQPDPVVADRAAFCLGDRGYYEVPRLHAGDTIGHT